MIFTFYLVKAVFESMKIDIQYNLIPSFILGEKLGNQITKKNHRKKCPEGQKNQDPGHDPGTKQLSYS